MHETVEAMRDANLDLGAFLAQYDSPALDLQAPIPDLRSVTEALERVGKCLEKAPVPPGLDEVSRAAVDTYIENLKRLKSTLERLQPQLEQRRDAIRGRLNKIRSAMSWVDSFHQTR